MTRAAAGRTHHTNASTGAEQDLPGATAKFALFGEVLWVGILSSMACLLVVTVPAALAAGSRHLHKYIKGEESSLPQYWTDFRVAARSGLIAGTIFAVAAALLMADIAIASQHVVPGWELVLGVGVLLLLLLLLVTVQSAACWTPADGWKTAVITAVVSLRRNPSGATLVLSAVILAVVVTWQLPPLVVPGIGCLIFAGMAIRVRQMETPD